MSQAIFFFWLGETIKNKRAKIFRHGMKSVIKNQGEAPMSLNLFIAKQILEYPKNTRADKYTSAVKIFVADVLIGSRIGSIIDGIMVNVMKMKIARIDPNMNFPLLISPRDENNNFDNIINISSGYYSAE